MNDRAAFQTSQPSFRREHREASNVRYRVDDSSRHEGALIHRPEKRKLVDLEFPLKALHSRRCGGLARNVRAINGIFTDNEDRDPGPGAGLAQVLGEVSAWLTVSRKEEQRKLVASNRPGQHLCHAVGQSVADERGRLFAYVRLVPPLRHEGEVTDPEGDHGNPQQEVASDEESHDGMSEQ